MGSLLSGRLSSRPHPHPQLIRTDPQLIRKLIRVRSCSAQKGSQRSLSKQSYLLAPFHSCAPFLLASSSPAFIRQYFVPCPLIEIK